MKHANAQFKSEVREQRTDHPYYICSSGLLSLSGPVEDRAGDRDARPSWGLQKGQKGLLAIHRIAIGLVREESILAFAKGGSDTSVGV